jgi:ATP-dependent Clp protease adaptor protein ClpS
MLFAASFLKPLGSYIGSEYLPMDSITGAAMTKDLYMMSDKRYDYGDTAVITETKPKTKRPPLYKVMLLNDDFTPMEFVVMVLERFFGVNQSQAFEIMLTVHEKGLAVVGVFSHEIAETKVAQVMDAARQNQHPLQCTMEKEE